MSSKIPRDPADELANLVASAIEDIRSRDPALATALDVAPPPSRKAAANNPVPAPPGWKNRAYRGLRKVYRSLKRVPMFRPLLEGLRSRMQHSAPPAAATSPTATPSRLFPALQRSFTIAFTMRSGSNEICMLLAKNGLGVPGEFFQKALMGVEAAGSDASFAAAFTRLVNEKQVNGVFGSKMAHDHRAAVDEGLRQMVPGYRTLDDVLPGHRWIWLQRRDKILQAISLCRAELSNRWSLEESTAGSGSHPEYDFIHILSRVMMIFAAELAWETYFAEFGIVPRVVIYEDFFQNRERELSQLIEFLGGLPPGRGFVDIDRTFQIQRDKQSYALRQRFTRDLGRLGETSVATELGQPLERWHRFFFERGWRG